MNEIEIVVRDSDKTNFSKYGDKARAEIRDGFKAGVDDAEKTADTRFGQIADKAGAKMGDRLREGTAQGFRGVESDVGKTMDNSVKTVTGKLRDARGKLVSEGEQMGAGLRAGLGKGVEGVGRDVNGAFSKIRKAMQSAESEMASAAKKMGGQGKLILIGIVNALAQLPAIASLVGGGLVLALGGALTAIAIKAQSSNADVRAAFSETKRHVSSEFGKMTVPFRDTLMHIAEDTTRAFDSIAPALTRTYAKMAPAVTRFSSDFANSLAKLNPAIDSLGTAFSRVLGSLGSRMGPIMNNFGTGIKAITDAVAKNPAAVSGFVEGFSKLFRYLGDGIGILIRFKDQFSQFMNVFAGPGPAGAIKMIGEVGEAFNKVKGMITGDNGDVSFFTAIPGAAGAASVAMDETGMSTRKLLSAQEIAAMTTDKLKAALDRLTGANQTAFDAQTAYREALRSAVDLGKKNNAGIDGNTAAADRNRTALSQLASTIKNDLGDKTPKQIEKMRQSFINAAEGMGVSKKRAKELADELLGVSGNMKKIPDKKDVKLGVKDETGAGAASAKRHLSFVDKAKSVALTVRDYVSSAAAKVQGALRKLGNKTIHLAQKGAEGAASAASRFGGAIKRLANRTVKIAQSGAGAAEHAVSSLMGAIKRLAGKTVKVGASVFGAGNVWGLVGAIRNVVSKTVNIVAHRFGFATGGIVGGQGMATGGISSAATGGLRSNLTLVGERGAELVSLPTGSRVIPHGQSMQQLAGLGGGGGGPVVLEIHSGGSRLDDVLLEIFRNAVRVRGGNVQVVLGKK
jgi:hypothetical protein